MINYIATFLLLILLGYVYDKYRSKMDKYDETENQKLIRKYLLNETFTPNNKPPLWIYVENEKNSRNWESFGSRNTYNLNQPYLYITLRSIINQANNEFNVCIINDSSISKLLPAWNVDMKKIAEPIRGHFRKLAMTKILYNYGGMFVPPSYLALKEMSEIYYTGLLNKNCFTVELPSNSILSNVKDTQPSIEFIGCTKNNTTMKELMKRMEILTSRDYTNDQDFEGNIERMLNEYTMKSKMSKISGKTVGCIDTTEKYISINELIATSHIDFSDNLHGIFVPQDEILRRTKYQWFARLSEEQIYKSEVILCKYMLLSNTI